MQVKVTISLDEKLLARIDRVADRLGGKRSSLMQKAVERMIPHYEWLADRMDAGPNEGPEPGEAVEFSASDAGSSSKRKDKKR